MDIDLKFDPEYVPDPAEITSLAGAVMMPGHAVVHRILKAIVDQTTVEMRNSDTENPKQCQERVRRCQVATSIYQEMVDRINLYVSQYAAVVNYQEGQIDPDITEGVIDMGELPKHGQDYALNSDDDFNFFQ